METEINSFMLAQTFRQLTAQTKADFAQAAGNNLQLSKQAEEKLFGIIHKIRDNSAGYFHAELTRTGVCDFTMTLKDRSFLREGTLPYNGHAQNVYIGTADFWIDFSSNSLPVYKGKKPDICPHPWISCGEPLGYLEPHLNDDSAHSEMTLALFKTAAKNMETLNQLQFSGAGPNYRPHLWTIAGRNPR